MNSPQPPLRSITTAIATPPAGLDIMGGTSHFSGGLCLNLRAHQLFAVSHQSDFEIDEVPIPTGVEFWALDGGPLPHSSVEIYRRAQTATWMGRKIVSTFAPKAMENERGERHLANLSADIWRAIRELVPESLLGAQFLATYADCDTTDLIIETNTEYRVRLATEHPVYENERSHKFVRFLESASSNPQARHQFLTAAGELMIQSHFSYDHRCHLGNQPSDLLVKLAREAGRVAGIYGAKLSGDGDSTTVALLCDRHKNPDLEGTIGSMAMAYRQQTGVGPHIFQGNKSGL